MASALQDRYLLQMAGYMKALVGGKIIEAGMGDVVLGEYGFGNEGFPYFIVEKNGEQFRVEVSQDSEGNGAGFLFGLPEVHFNKAGKLVDSLGKTV